MAHCRLLFIGGRANLDQIFNNCPDSSSESAAEMAIGADWVADYDWISDEEKSVGWTTNDFTKENKELYKQVLDGLWYECYDIRDVNHYGDFDCLNCPDYEPYDGTYDDDRDKRNKQRAIKLIKQLPDDTLFHFAESHW